MTNAAGQTPRGHEPVIPLVDRPSVPALDRGLVDRFRQAPVPDVSDAVGRLYTMNSQIRPLYQPMPRVIGSAVTVKAVPGDNWAIHAGLSRCSEGDVLVVDWRGYTEACGTGGLTTARAMRRGLAGIVIDGAWRDIAELERLGFAIMGTGISPFSPGASRLGEVNVPVSCGGVIVCPGDLIVGDHEGAAVVPREHVKLVAESLPQHQELDSLTAPALEALGDGMSQAASLYWERAALQQVSS